MKNSPYPIYLIDDDESILTSLTTLLTGSGYEVNCFRSGDEFIAQLREDLRGVVVLDVMMPGRDGLEVLSLLRQGGSHLRVMIITGHADVPMAVNALKMGAVDFLEKPFHPKDLLERVSTLLEECALDEEPGMQVEPTIHTRFASLTAREYLVLSGVVRGLSNKEIAERIDMSLRTVQMSRTLAMQKAGFRNRSELMEWIVSNSISLRDFQVEP